MTASLAAAANRRGILYMLGAVACFVANDAIVKYASQSLPTAQLIFMRGAMATVLILAVARATGATARVAESMRGWVLVRAAVDAVATMLYLSSLFQLPIANATAINLAAPIFMTVFAAMFMHERVGFARWLAIAVGFMGVVLIIQPRADGFNIYALVCLAGTVLHATRDLLTRRIPATVPSLLITLATSAAVTLLAGALSLLQGWRPFGAEQLGLLAMASVFLAAGYYLIINSLRHGEMSLIAPFRYSGLLFAVVLGYTIWGDVPNLVAWSGIALLVGSGLYVLHHERRRVRRAAALDAS